MTLRKLRILFLAEYYAPMVGGLELFTAALAQSLIKRGHDVEVLTAQVEPAWAEKEIVDGVSVTRLSWLAALGQRSPDALLGMRRATAALKREFQPDVVVLNGIGPGALLHIQTQGPKERSVAVLQLSLFTGQQTDGNTLFQRVLAGCDWIVAPAQSVLDDVATAVPAILPKASVIGNSHDRDYFDVGPCSPDRAELLCLGRLEHIKGFDVAIEAFVRIASDFPDARLCVAGRGSSRAALEKQAADSGFGDRVAFTGVVDHAQARELFERSCMVVMPSRFEGFGIVALEAAQAARPVIASRIPGPQDIVVEGETGLLVPRDDVGALAQAIASLLKNRRHAEQLGLAARDRAASQFGWTSITDAYESLFYQLVD